MVEVTFYAVVAATCPIIVNIFVHLCYRMVEQKLPERAVTLFMKACEVAEVGPYNLHFSHLLFIVLTTI